MAYHALSTYDSNYFLFRSIFFLALQTMNDSEPTENPFFIISFFLHDELMSRNMILYAPFATLYIHICFPYFGYLVATENKNVSHNSQYGNQLMKQKMLEINVTSDTFVSCHIKNRSVKKKRVVFKLEPFTTPAKKKN